MFWNNTHNSCGCKIGKNRKKHGLTSLNETLARKRREEGTSLRNLARFVNIQILDTILSDTEADIVGNPSSIYDAISDENVPINRRVMITDQLQTQGIDVDELRGDFVSYQTVRRHFQDCMGIPTDRQGVDSVDEAREVIEWSQERHENILERTLGRLHRKGIVHFGDPTIRSSLTISCDDCGEIYGLEEFLTEKACKC